MALKFMDEAGMYQHAHQQGPEAARQLHMAYLHGMYPHGMSPHGMSPHGMYQHGMHPFSKDDHSEGGWTSDEDRTLLGRRCLLRCCLCCCGVMVLGLLLVPLGVGMYFNHHAAGVVENIGSFLLGVNVTVEDATLHSLQGDVSMTALNVANPPGYPGAFATMNGFAFDLSLLSLLKSHLPLFNQLLHIRNMTVDNCRVALKMKSPVGTSNAEEILNHLNNATARIDQELHKQHKSKTLADKLEVKVEVNDFLMRNVTASFEVHPMPAVSYTIHSIHITDVGTSSNGVPLYQFMEIVARTFLESAIMGAPKEAATKLASAVGVNISKPMDYAKAEVDKVGDGLGALDLSNFSSWAAQAASALEGNATAALESHVEQGFLSSAKDAMNEVEDKLEHILGLDH